MKVIEQANKYTLLPNDIVSILDTLPIGIYLLIETKSGFVLERRESNMFETINDTYGQLPKLRQKFNKDILRHDKLGIMLIGEKGCGKTLLAKQLCNDSKLPVIMINEATSSALGEFITNIPNKFILLIDKFEKIFPNGKYNDEEDKQQILLSVLDGTTNSNFISIFTANEANRVNDYFKNRPKRIKYYIEFKSLTKEEIKEFLLAKNINKELYEKLINLTYIVNNVNYDMLSEILNELEEYPEYSLKDLLLYLNIEVSDTMYNITCYSNNKCIGKYNRDTNPYTGFNYDSYLDITTKDGKLLELDDWFEPTEYDIHRVEDTLICITKDDVIVEDIDLGKLTFRFDKVITNTLTI